MPLISVIIPCYRTEAGLLSRCLKSIKKQTLSDIEIIIVDDGNTVEYRKIYKNNDFKSSNIKIYFRNNEGVSAARNFGVSVAAGSYIVFADADDVLVNTFLEEAYSIAVSHKSDCVIGGEIDIKRLEEYLTNPVKNYSIIDYENEEIERLKKYQVGKYFYHFSSGISVLGQGPWTRLIRTEIAKETPFDISLPIGEDVVWNFEILKKAKIISVAETIWYGYFYNPNSSTRRFRENAVQESYDSLVKIREYLNMQDDDEYRAFCSRCYIDLYRIFTCYISCKNVSIKEKIKFSHRVYSEYPWKEIANHRYYKLVSKKDKFSILMYRTRLLFFYYQFIQKFTKKE